MGPRTATPSWLAPGQAPKARNGVSRWGVVGMLAKSLELPKSHPRHENSQIKGRSTHVHGFGRADRSYAAQGAGE